METSTSQMRAFDSRERDAYNPGNVCYRSNIINFASLCTVRGSSVKKLLLLLTSVFIAFAGLWLAVMESALKHDGYIGRAIIALAVLTQGLATLFWIGFGGRALFRILLAAGAIAAALLALSAFKGLMSTPHFEGFVLTIGVALLLQSALTLITLLSTAQRTAK